MVSAPARQVPSDIPDDGDLGLTPSAHIGPRPDAEHARLSLALEASTDLVLTATRGDDRIRMNPAAARILSDAADTTDATTDLDALLSRTPSWVRHRFLNEAAPALEVKGLWEGELSFHDRTGATIPLSVVMVALRDARGEIETVAVVARDITERKEFEQRLAHQATHDPLTGLPNRTLLVDRLHMAMARGGRTGRLTGVLFLDLDNFKVVNDSLGHSAGDTLLVEVARRVQAAVRPGDTVARFGGDEFVVLCEELERGEEALEIARRIEEAIADPVSIDDTEVTVTVSIGVATSEDSGVAEAIIRDADAAMYEAKARGRSRTEMFDAAMHVQAVDRLALESSLRRALDRHEMRVAYQPQIDLATGRIIGAESLVRWEHPERGILLPGEFLPIAEETGLIVPIGNWITATACRAMARLRDLEPLLSEGMTMSVNLSARQLGSPALVDDLAAVLEETRLPHGALVIEITETDLMDVEASGTALKRIHELGVGVAVDDFGTGWSSLRYLRQFPVDVLKVDRSFVAGLGRDAEDEAIVGAVIDLAHALGQAAIAEGVEDQIQLDRLRALGCDGAQGWLIGMPMAEADLIDRVASQQAGPIPT